MAIARGLRTIAWSLSTMSPADRSRWDRFVTDHTGGTLYHLSSWSELLQRSYGFRPVCLALTDDDNADILGILPLCYVESRLTGRRLISLPCTNSVGPFCRPGVDPRTLLTAAADLASNSRCRYLEIRDQPVRFGLEAAPLERLDYYGTFLLDLEGNALNGLPAIDKRARRGIARAARDGVQTRFLDDESAPQIFYRLNLLTRHKHGVPPQPLSFFANLWSVFRPGGHVEILVAELEGQPIASIVLLAFNETVTYAYGASDARFLKHAPNHALFDAALGWTIERGYRYFDFGRTAPDNEGLMEFKRQWGAQYLPLPYFYYPHRGGFVGEAEASWKHRLFTSAWRKLPVGLTAVVGPTLYRHVA